MTQNDQANILLKLLEKNGYSGYKVGGCVRDTLLNTTVNDIDICTSAKPEEVINIFKEYTVVPTGLKHGTVTIIVGGESFDVTTYRIESGYNDYRHPDKVDFVSNIDEDLSRRDFTINAMAQDSSGIIHDPFNGQKDLKEKIIRAVGDPDQRFKEDPLRMLRAIRFSAKLGFTIEEHTLNAIKINSQLLEKISGERIRDELKKILIYDPEKVQLLEETGLLKVFLPEVTELFNCKQLNKWHYTDAMHHTFDALKYSKKFDYLSDTKKFYIRMILLLHDIGKSDTEFLGDDGYQHYYGHPEYSYLKAKPILERLKFSNYEIDIISKVVRYHDITTTPKRRTLNRVITEYGFSLYEFKLLGYVKECDISAHVPQANDKRLSNYFKLLKMFKQKINNDNIMTINDIAISGDDIMRLLNLKPSKKIGEIKKDLFNMVFYKPSLNKKEILEHYIIDNYERCDDNEKNN